MIRAYLSPARRRGSAMIVSAASEVAFDGKVDVSAVLVSYRSKAVIVDCLGGLEAARTNCEVVVVDNASDDGSADFVATEFASVVLVRNSENVGFARAVNRALPLCVGRYILLLNPDAHLEPGSLEQLVAILDAEPGVGAVGPVMHQPGGRRRVLEAGRQLTTWRMLMHLSGLSRLSRDLPALEGVYLIRGVHDDRRRDVEWLSGACVLIRSTVFAELGALSERWFMYAEDFEFSLRMTRANWRLSHVPESRVSHDMSTSSAPTDRRVAWALAWSDFHRTELASNAATHAAWRMTFAAMLVTRASRAVLKAGTDRKHAHDWFFEARGLATCAVKVISDPNGSARQPTPTHATRTGTGSTRR